MRVVCRRRGLFGTVISAENGPTRPLRAGVLYDVRWLDYPDEGPDEIDGGQLIEISEGAYLVEVVERGLDAEKA